MRVSWRFCLKKSVCACVMLCIERGKPQGLHVPESYACLDPGDQPVYQEEAVSLEYEWSRRSWHAVMVIAKYLMYLLVGGSGSQSKTT